ncbi:prolyl oligopeptidase family serine peptidase [Bernardetia sp. OM2101]|uniref:carboxylesterase family protein n=1 Tax=Bernardetia sp. OM2101 TaxID=3344876 RepID=UPI0035D05845
MNFLLILIKTLFFTFLCFICFYNKAQTTQTEVIYFPTVKNKSVKELQTKTGEFEYEFLMTDKSKWKARLFIPNIKEEQKIPLVIALHWAGNKNVYKEFATCLAFPAFDSKNVIIVAPSSEGKMWTDEPIEIRLIRLVKQLKKYLPIDEDKIMIMGYSNGGIASWQFALKYPKLFSVALPMAAIYSSKKITIPVYALHGKNDELFDVENSEKSLLESISKGSKIEYKIIENLSHYMACNYLEELKKMIDSINKEVF